MPMPRERKSQQNYIFKICLANKEWVFGLELRENLVKAEKRFKLLILTFIEFHSRSFLITCNFSLNSSDAPVSVITDWAKTFALLELHFIKSTET